MKTVWTNLTEMELEVLVTTTSKVESSRESTLNFHFFFTYGTQLKREVIRQTSISLWSFRNSLERGFRSQHWVPTTGPWEKSTNWTGQASKQTSMKAQTLLFRGWRNKSEPDLAAPRLHKQDSCLVGSGAEVQGLSWKTMWVRTVYAPTKCLSSSLVTVFTSLLDWWAQLL